MDKCLNKSIKCVPFFLKSSHLQLWYANFTRFFVQKKINHISRFSFSFSKCLNYLIKPVLYRPTFLLICEILFVLDLKVLESPKLHDLIYRNEKNVSKKMKPHVRTVMSTKMKALGEGLMISGLFILVFRC